MTNFGTGHFVDIVAARQYYVTYGFNARDVDRKLAEGEIHIGPPPLKTGESFTINKEQRYAIVDEWSGGPDPKDPDNYWIDDATGERVSAATGERTAA